MAQAQTTRPRKTPQDRKPKQSDMFEFVGADGKTYRLPPPSTARPKMTLGQYLDAANVEDESKLALQMLAAVAQDLAPAAKAALRGLSGAEMDSLVNDWFMFSRQGATGPQS